MFEGKSCVFINLNEIKERIHERIISRGAVGIQGLGHLFRITDANSGTSFDIYRELPGILCEAGIVLNKIELNEFMRLLDYKGSGRMTYDDLARHFAPKMSPKRLNAVGDVFNKLDVNGTQYFYLADIFSKNPELASRNVTPVMNNFIRCFDGIGNDRVSINDFYTYYRDVSANFSSDDRFIETLYRSWGLEPPI